MRSTVLLVAFSTMSVLACGGDDTTDPQTGNGTPTVATVVVTPGNASLVSLGETVQLTGSAQDASGNTLSGKTFTWSSSDANITTVSASGLVTAIANGVATITATTDNVSGTANLTVAQEVSTVEVTPNTATLFVGGTTQLVATSKDANGNEVLNATVIWSTSDAAIASVDAAGLVTGVALGTAIITAESNGKTPTTVITVVPAAFGTATIDGVFGAGEWDNATTFTFDADIPGEFTGTTPATIFVMNDATNLYMAVRFARTVVDAANSMSIAFDVDGSGSLSEGDDEFVVVPSLTPPFVDYVRSTLPPCPTGALCSIKDTDLGGTNDGVGAFANDGAFTLYEASHPLNSGDTNDFALVPGDVTRFQMFLRMIRVPSVFPVDFGDTTFPATGFKIIGIAAGS